MEAANHLAALPRMHCKDLGSCYGMTSEVDRCNRIWVSSRLIEILKIIADDPAADVETRNSGVLVLGGTILHELGHWRWQCRVSEGQWQTIPEPLGPITDRPEAGEVVETAVFGGVVWHNDDVRRLRLLMLLPGRQRRFRPTPESLASVLDTRTWPPSGPPLLTLSPVDSDDDDYVSTASGSPAPSLDATGGLSLAAHVHGSGPSGALHVEVHNDTATSMRLPSEDDIPCLTSSSMKHAHTGLKVPLRKRDAIFQRGPFKKWTILPPGCKRTVSLGTLGALWDLPASSPMPGDNMVIDVRFSQRGFGLSALEARLTFCRPQQSTHALVHVR